MRRRHVLEVGRGQRLVDAIELVEGQEAAAETDVLGKGGGDLLGIVERAQQAVALARQRVAETLLRHHLGGGPPEGAEDLVAHVERVLHLLDPRQDGGERRVFAGGGEGEELVHLLLLVHEALAQVRGGTEGQGEQHVHGRPVLPRLRERGAVEGHAHVGQGGARPGNVGGDRTGGRGLGRDTGGEGPAPPGPPVLFHQREDLGRLHVSRDDDRDVLGPVPAVEELLRVGKLVGHVLDVLEEAHRGVLVGVGRVRVVALDFDELGDGACAVLVVLAEHRPGLGLEVLLAVGEVLETVGFHLEDLRQVFLRERRVVVRVVVGGVGVAAGPRPGEHRLILLWRVGLRPSEHHVLEEVRETRLAGLHLVPRPGLHRDLERDDVREAGGDHDDPEPVRQRLLGYGQGEDVGLSIHGQETQEKHEGEPREE
jgi:hypothetical protein